MLHISTPELRTPDSGLAPFLTRPLHNDMAWVHEYTKPPVEGSYAHILDLLTPEAIDLMNDLPFGDNGKCPTELLEQHPVARPLIRTMGKLSLMNRLNHPDPTKIHASLRQEQGHNVRLAAHRDFLDGHAVIFNWDVRGNLHYVIGGRRVKVDSNEIIVINGAADHISVAGLVSAIDGEQQEWGFATKPHAVEGEGYTSRKRLLVYADGVDTTVSQLVA